MFDDSGTPAKVEEVAVGVLLSLSWLTVSARFWVRAKLTKSMGWDDFFMLFTLILFTFYCAFMLVIISRGGFQRTPLHDTLPRTAIFILMGEVFYILSTIFLKVSLALFFLRVLVKKWQRWTFYIALGIATASGISYTVLAVFQCGVPTKLVENILAQKCIPRNLNIGFGYFYSSINVLSDWTFVIVPIFMLRESTMERRAKISVGIIMCMGAVASVSSIIRMFYLEGAIFGPNFFEHAANLAIWSTIEPGIGIIAGSLATLRPLLRAAVHLTRRTVSHSQSGSQSFGNSNRPGLRLTTLMRSNNNGFQAFHDDDVRVTTSITGGRQARGHEEEHKGVVRWASMKSIRSKKSMDRGHRGFGASMQSGSTVTEPWGPEGKPFDFDERGAIQKVVEVNVTRENSSDGYARRDSWEHGTRYRE